VKPVKIATWNVNSLKVRLPHVLDWLAAESPDALALQETKLTDDQFPVAELAQAGYRAVFAGQKAYNGVAILSRLEPAEVLTDIPGLEDPDRRILAATLGELRLINLYVVNGQEVGSERYAYKLQWLARVAEHVRAELARYPRLAVVGDFNVAPEDRDVFDPEGWREHIHCSTPEREALGGLLAVGLTDCFRLFDQPEKSFSWWDYRQGSFRRNLGLRIDLVLASEALAKGCTACTVDRGPRALERPSDHAPVVATFED
jgi:exodeoxyribonuclease-3